MSDVDYEIVLKASKLDKMKKDWVAEGRRMGFVQGQKQELEKLEEYIYELKTQNCTKEHLIEQIDNKIEGRLREVEKK